MQLLTFITTTPAGGWTPRLHGSVPFALRTPWSSAPGLHHTNQELRAVIGNDFSEVLVCNRFKVYDSTLLAGVAPQDSVELS